MEYRIFGQIDFDDYKQYLEILKKKTFTIKDIFIKCFMIFGFFCSLLFLREIFSYGNVSSLGELIIFLLENRRNRNTILFIIFAIAGMIFLCNDLLYFLKRKIMNGKANDESEKKAFKINKQIRDKCDYIINESFILINKNIKLNEKSVYQILFDANSIYILTGKKRVNIIKKRFFENKEIYDELVEFLKKYYKEKIVVSNVA